MTKEGVADDGGGMSVDDEKEGWHVASVKSVGDEERRAAGGASEKAFSATLFSTVDNRSLITDTGSPTTNLRN